MYSVYPITLLHETSFISFISLITKYYWSNLLYSYLTITSFNAPKLILLSLEKNWSIKLWIIIKYNLYFKWTKKLYLLLMGDRDVLFRKIKYHRLRGQGRDCRLWVCFCCFLLSPFFCIRNDASVCWGCGMIIGFCLSRPYQPTFESFSYRNL